MSQIATSFADRREIARLTARALLDIGAVQFSAGHPFTFSSGLASPVYIDVRRVISYPRIREMMMDFASTLLVSEIGFEQVDAVAGGETAGIPFAAWVAANMGLPMQYVRKRPQGFGPGAQIEGVLTPGQRVLLVEDLTTDGGSKIRFCEALRRAGAQVSDVLMIFHYDIFPQTREALARHGLRLHALANWRDVLEIAREQGSFPAETLDEITRFLDTPLDWSARHGGATRIAL